VDPETIVRVVQLQWQLLMIWRIAQRCCWAVDRAVPTVGLVRAVPDGHDGSTLGGATTPGSSSLGSSGTRSSRTSSRSSLSRAEAPVSQTRPVTSGASGATAAAIRSATMRPIPLLEHVYCRPAHEFNIADGPKRICRFEKVIEKLERHVVEVLIEAVIS